MRKHSLVDQMQVFAAAATVAAHANAQAEGFRQRDVKFMLDLFCNWVETDFGEISNRMQNTQIKRYLGDLNTEGYARTLIRNKRPIYRLTRTGLIELIAAMLNQRPQRFDYFLFMHYFISNYKAKILDLVKAEGKQYPYALELELKGLLDEQALLAREVQRVERELKNLQVRVYEAERAGALLHDGLAKGRRFEEIISDWEKLYPYGLNSQKPLSELFKEIAPDIARWELEAGNLKRVEYIWKPQYRMMQQYLDQLKSLAQTCH